MTIPCDGDRRRKWTRVRVCEVCAFVSSNADGRLLLLLLLLLFHRISSIRPTHGQNRYNIIIIIIIIDIYLHHVCPCPATDDRSPLVRSPLPPPPLYDYYDLY